MEKLTGAVEYLYFRVVRGWQVQMDDGGKMDRQLKQWMWRTTLRKIYRKFRKKYAMKITKSVYKVMKIFFKLVIRKIKVIQLTWKESVKVFDETGRRGKVEWHNEIFSLNIIYASLSVYKGRLWTTEYPDNDTSRTGLRAPNASRCPLSSQLCLPSVLPLISLSGWDCTPPVYLFFLIPFLGRLPSFYTCT